jgi:hypothetical protein
MSNSIDATMLLMIPFGAALAFCIWALWGFSNEIRAGGRQRVRRSANATQVLVYAPPQPALRFRRCHDQEAA